MKTNTELAMTRLAAALALATASILCMPIPAKAMAFCHPLETPDGFVALRAGPGSKFRIVAKMKPADEVMYGLRQKGNWSEVTWWRGDDRLEKGFGAHSGKGWVNSKLIEEEC